MRRNLFIASLCLVTVLGYSAALAQPLTTAFTFQGELASAGTPVSGTYDLRFLLFDNISAGAQVGLAQCADNVLVANGRFTVQLDFGSQFSGQQRFLEVWVRQDTGLNCASNVGFTVMSPRQSLTAAPNAAYALTAASATTATTATTATNATQFNGQPASFYQNAANISSGSLADARLAGSYTGPLTFSNAGNTFTGTHSGSGAGLTGLNWNALSNVPPASGDLTGTYPSLTIATSAVSSGKLLSDAASLSKVTHGMMTTDGTNFVGINAAAPIASGKFVVTQTTTGFGGMYVNTSSASGLPFYGYAQNGGPVAYHYVDSTNIWKLVNGGVTAMSVSTTGEVAIGGNPFTNYGLGVTSPVAGLFGYSTNTTGATQGVLGQVSSPSGYGVFGVATAGGTSYAVYGNGNFGATGTKSFRIDHPSDPLNKYLLHYCSEGPEPLNIYRGTIRTDAKGEAWVLLPDYYAEINKDPSYQLTVIEDADTDSFVQAKVAAKIRNNRFKIRTSAPNVEVCWRVEAVRNDAWVQKHGAPVEVEKEGSEKGKYQRPELYDQPASMGMNHDLGQAVGDVKPAGQP